MRKTPCIADGTERLPEVGDSIVLCHYSIFYQTVSPGLLSRTIMLSAVNTDRNMTTQDLGA
jgi:hypothetical protein